MNRESTKSLSIEIIDIIFQNLPRKSLYECQRVCQLWYSYVTRHLMNYIIFRDQRKILRFLECQSSLTKQVKKMKIDIREFGYSNLQPLTKEVLGKLMMKVPNLQELKIRNSILPICDLNDIEIPKNLKHITASYTTSSDIQDTREFIKLLTKFRGTIQKIKLINECKPEELFENWDMAEFFGSFPKLTELDVKNLYGITCLTDCLPILQAIPSLKSIFLLIRKDLNDMIQFEQKFDTIKMLEIFASIFIPNTLLSISRNFVNLKEINIEFFNCIINNSSNAIALLEFLNFMYSIDTYKFVFNTDHEFYLQHLSDFLQNTFAQLPENSQNVTRELCFNVGYRAYRSYQMPEIRHDFQLKSYRDYCNRLQKRIKWHLGYDKVHIDEVLRCLDLLDNINVDILTFHMCYTPLLSRCFDFFVKLISLLVGLKKIVVVVSRYSKWYTKYKPFMQFNHITQLEMQILVKTEGVKDRDIIPVPLVMFPNLKMLRFVYWCGSWCPDRNSYSLDLSLQNLESLHLDITPLVFEVKYLNISKTFKLVVETSTVRHLYDVSLPSLHATKISQVESEEFLNNDCILLYIKIQSIQKLHLKGSESSICSYHMSLSTPPYEMETLIIL